MTPPQELHSRMAVNREMIPGRGTAPALLRTFRVSFVQRKLRFLGRSTCTTLLS